MMKIHRASGGHVYLSGQDKEGYAWRWDCDWKPGLDAQEGSCVSQHVDVI